MVSCGALNSISEFFIDSKIDFDMKFTFNMDKEFYKNNNQKLFIFFKKLFTSFFIISIRTCQILFRINVFKRFSLVKMKTKNEKNQSPF